MPEYKKKPVKIHAYQWDGTREGASMIMEAVAEKTSVLMLNYTDDPDVASFTVNTLEGVMTISPRDYIIVGIQGEVYPCKPDIFEASYDTVLVEE